jgi:hypothetical protein
MKPSAYISPNGILYKELPPDSLLKLTPLYTLDDLTKNKEIYESFFVKTTNIKESK